MDLRRKQALRYSVYGTLGMVVLLLLLNPFTRQALFGPTVLGEPLCTWQERFREKCGQPGKRSSFGSLSVKVANWFGVGLAAPQRWPNALTSDLLPVVLSLVNDSDPEVRAAVATELGRQPHSAEIGAVLMAMLDDVSPAVRAATAYALTQDEHRYDGALPKLRRLMDDADGLCRTRAAIAVCIASRPPDRQAYDVLVNTLRLPLSQGHLEAVRCLCALAKDFPESLPDVALVARSDPAVRRIFVERARPFGLAAIPVLAEFLDDGDLVVRLGAVASLGAISVDAKIVPPALVGALHNPDFAVRHNAYIFPSDVDPDRYPPKQPHER